MTGFRFKALTATVFILAVSRGWSIEQPVPTGFPNHDQQEALRKLVETDSGVADRWRNFESEARAALDDDPSPLREILYEGHLDNDPDRVRTVASLADMDKLDNVIKAWVISGDEAYAAKAREFIHAWTARYVPTGNPINENKLEPIFLGYAMLEDSFSAEEQESIEHWIHEMASKGIEHARTYEWSTVNNWHPKRLKIVAWAGLILDESTFVDYASEEARDYIELSLRPDGSSYDLEQRDALSYHVGGIRPLLSLAAILSDTGFDLYNYTSPSGASVRKSVEFVVPYAVGEKTRAEFVNTTVELDRRRAEAGLEKYRPGRLYDPARSIGLFELAVAFDSAYWPVLAKVTEERESRYPTWRSVLSSVGWVQEELSK